MTERIDVTVNGTVYSVEIDSLDKLKGAPFEVRVNGHAYAVQLGQPSEATKVTASESPTARPAASAPMPQPAAAPAPAAATGQRQQVTAPMPGKILSVAVQVGAHVQAKATLCTLEAMKMEMTIAAPVAGTVREVQAEVGASVVFGDLLFVIE